MVAVVAAVVAPGPLAQAADDGAARARALHRQAVAAFEAGDFDQAFARFQAGYQLSRRPVFLLNMAHARRRQGHLDQSLQLYRRFLLVAPDSRLRPQVEEVVRALELVEAAEGHDEPSPSLAELVALSVRPECRLSTVSPAAPGAAESAGGEPVCQEPVRGAPARAAPAPGVLAARPPLVSSPAPAPFYRRPWFWVLAGSVVASAVVGARLLGQSRAPAPGGSLGSLGAP